MEFTLTYSETRKQVLVLLLVPSAITAIMVAVLLNASGWDDWQVVTLLVTVLIAAVVATIYLLRKQVQVPCTVQVTPSHFMLRLQRVNRFYPEPLLTVPWHVVANVHDENYNGALYTNFKITEPRRKFILAPLNRKDPTAYLRFVELLKTTVRGYNTQAAVQGEAVITSKSFFDTAAARVIAWGLIGAIAVMVIGYLAGENQAEFPLYRLVQISVVGIPFIIRVLLRRKTE